MRYTVLLAAALSLGPGCDTTFGTLTLIGSGVEAVTTVIKSGPPAEEENDEAQSGGDH